MTKKYKQKLEYTRWLFAPLVEEAKRWAQEQEQEEKWEGNKTMKKFILSENGEKVVSLENLVEVVSLENLVAMNKYNPKSEYGNELTVYFIYLEYSTGSTRNLGFSTEKARDEAFTRILGYLEKNC